VEGTIQGLVRGGFIHLTPEYSLPQNGLFITTINSAETKYQNAWNYFNAKIGMKTDLYDTFKMGVLGIDQAQLLIKNGTGVSPAPSSFSLDHSYIEGSVKYNASYDKNTASGVNRGYSTISIVRNDPTDIVQEFIVPGRSSGPIIQKLNMKTPRTISINISGASDDLKNCDKISDRSICNMPNIGINGLDALRSDPRMIVTKDDFTSNSIDGSFSLTLELTYKRA
jgi:hypothetical protein